jgi:hypothetical protein
MAEGKPTGTRHPRSLALTSSARSQHGANTFDEQPNGTPIRVP